MGSSPTNLKCCERTLVTLILRMYFWAFKCQSWLWLHLSCSVRSVISRLWIGSLTVQEFWVLRKSMLRMLLYHLIWTGMVLDCLVPRNNPYCPPQRPDSSGYGVCVGAQWKQLTREQVACIWDRQPVLFTSGDSEQIWNMWYQVFIQGAAGRRTEILCCLIEKVFLDSQGIPLF